MLVTGPQDTSLSAFRVKFNLVFYHEKEKKMGKSLRMDAAEILKHPVFLGQAYLRHTVIGQK